MSDYQAPPGVFDILPNNPKDPWTESHLWQYVESIIRECAKVYGYQEMRTPVLEKTELFIRTSGETSDVVSKELYTFEDRGGRSLSLRPEGTAPAMRAFNEHRLAHTTSFHKLYYIGPMFRYDRPQAGRYRQHHQFGAEAIGNAGADQDAEVIDLLLAVYRKLGLKDVSIYVNTLGNKTSRALYIEKLVDYLQPHLSSLSEDSKRRLTANPLRILDSKDPKDQELVKRAPTILDCLDEESATRFEELKKWLNLLNIPYQVNSNLVRGLDYYNHTVFEVVSGKLGAQNSIGGGGRYDGLIEALGGKALPACGFGTGIERIIQTMIAQGITLPVNEGPLVYVIPLGDAAKAYTMKWVHDLREKGFSCQLDMTGRKVGKAIEYAEMIRSRYVVVVGEDELNQNKPLDVKDLKNKERFSVQSGSFEDWLREIR